MESLIRKYIGIPFQHGGRTLQGLDCIGLVICFLRDNSVDLPDDDGKEITRDWYKKDYMRMLHGLRTVGDKIPAKDIRPLDIVVFRINGVPRHAGVVVDYDKFLHIRQHKTVTAERLSKWSRLFHSAFRVRGDG